MKNVGNGWWMRPGKACGGRGGAGRSASTKIIAIATNKTSIVTDFAILSLAHQCTMFDINLSLHLHCLRQPAHWS